MYLLDTDTISLLFLEKEPLVSRVRKQSASDLIGITIITKAEVLRGRIDYLLKASDGRQFIRAQELFLRTESFLNGLALFSISEESNALFERLIAQKGLRKCGRADLLIASVALRHKAVLVTRNMDDFKKIPQLKLVNWAD